MNDSERAGVIKATIESALVEFNVCIPAVVTKLEGGDFITARPLIKKVRMKRDGSKEYEETEEIESVKVMNLSCNGFGIRIPLTEGCEGLLVFADYDLDNWKDKLGKEPHTDRYHDQNDCLFYPAFNKGSKNDHKCLELYSDNTTISVCDDCIKLETKNVELSVCEDTFDVVKDGKSLIREINLGFASCGCPPPLLDWEF